MLSLTYFIPDEVEIADPPTIVRIIKKIDKSNSDECKLIPDVEIQETIIKKIFKKPSFGVMRKYINSIVRKMMIIKWKSSKWSENLNWFVIIL